MDTLTLFALPTVRAKHPARYTDALLATFARMLRGRKRILDPFGGTGKVFLLNHWLPDAQIEAVEIEPEWANINPRTVIGNALYLPYADSCFDAICTSPTYGNRMADGLRQSALDGKWTTRTYADLIRRDLHPDNSGGMQWGEEYRTLHIRAWTEARRVLADRGIFVLNCKNHIRGSKLQRVTEWHIEMLQALGFELIEHVAISCPGMRYGENAEARVDSESVILFALNR